MNHFNNHATLTDQLERQLIQQEIGRQMSYAPVINLKRVADKIASLFGYVRADRALSNSYATR